MRVHFICNGNAYRSRLAEGYFQSLHTGIESLSTGVRADKSRVRNDPKVTDFTKNFLKEQGVACQLTLHPVQLTQDMLRAEDVTVIINDNVLENAKGKFTLPTNIQVWDITDHDQQEGPPEQWLSIQDHTAKIFAQIKTNIDDLVVALKAK